MVVKNDGYMMLLDALFIGSKKVGYIAEEGIDWGGDDAQFIELNAAQVRTAPVKKIPKKAATNVLTFTLIELLPDNCVMVMGGSVDGDKWKAPSNVVIKEDAVKILTGTGQTIEIPKASITSALRGSLGGDTALGLDVRLEVLDNPENDYPFSIAPTVPFITSEVSSLSFIAAGEKKTIDISASGAFAVSGVLPEGFTVSVVSGKVAITATENSGMSERSGDIVFALADDPTKKITISVTQAY